MVKKMIIVWFFLSVFFLFASNSDSLFKQGDRLFIYNQNEKAITFYKKVVQNNDDSKLVMLSLYKLGYINETRLFDYEKAKIWYSKLIKEFPDSRHSILAISRLQKITEIGSKDNLEIYEKFKRARWNYYISKKNLSIKEQQKKAKNLYNYAKKYQNQIFFEEMLQDSIEVLFDAKLFSLVHKASKKYFPQYPSLKKKFNNMVNFSKYQILRKNLFIISLSLIALLLLSSMVMKKIKKAGAILYQNFTKHWVFFLSFFVVFSVIYIIMFALTRDLVYKFIPHLALLLTFILSFASFAVFNETFDFLNKIKWFVYISPILGLIFSISWIIIYAYLFDYMWLFGI